MEDSAFPKTLSPRSALCCSTSSYMAPTALMIFQWSPAFQTLYIYGSVFLMLHGRSPKKVPLSEGLYRQSDCSGPRRGETRKLCL